ncbi:MAG: hypothetical protein AABX96_02240 [Nanoarchaeota archaeon]
MKIENHLESFNEHKETIFDWAVKVKGIKNSQRVIGLHASRAIIDLLSIYLIKRNLISTGMKINHRWFKSEKVNENLPEFDKKEEICSKITKLELLCEDLTYGAPKTEEKINEALELFNKLEGELNG